MTDTGRQQRSVPTVNYAVSSDSEQEDVYAEMDYNDGYESDSSIESNDQRPHKRARTTSTFKSAASTLQPHTTIEILDFYQLFIQSVIPTFKLNDANITTDPESISYKLFDHIILFIYNTNIDRYRTYCAKLVLNSKSKDPNFGVHFTPLQLQDINAFIGSLYRMDIYNFPDIKMYWGLQDSLVKIKEIKDAISYNKFIKIKNSLGFEDPNTLFQMICSACDGIIGNSNELAVDEQLKKFKGRYANKVAMSQKPAGTGVKSFIIADSNTNLPCWYSIEGKGKTNLEVNNMNKYSSVAASLVAL